MSKFANHEAIRRAVNSVQDSYNVASILYEEAKRRADSNEHGTVQAFLRDEAIRAHADYRAMADELYSTTLLVENPSRLSTKLRFVTEPEVLSFEDFHNFFSVAIDAARLAITELGEDIGTSADGGLGEGITIRLPSRPPEMTASETVRRATYVGNTVMEAANTHPYLVGRMSVAEVLPEITIQHATVERIGIVPGVRFPIVDGQILVGLEQAGNDL